MNNKQLQEFLAQYPDDMDILLNCSNHHTGQTYAYSLLAADTVKRIFYLCEKKNEHEFITLVGRAE